MPTGRGTPAYNQRLSLRRAQTVAAELVRDGVPMNEIAIQAFGDTRPLVPTAPGRARAAEPSRGDHPAIASQAITPLP